MQFIWPDANAKPVSADWNMKLILSSWHKVAKNQNMNGVPFHNRMSFAISTFIRNFKEFPQSYKFPKHAGRKAVLYVNTR